MKKLIIFSAFSFYSADAMNALRNKQADVARAQMAAKETEGSAFEEIPPEELRRRPNLGGNAQKKPEGPEEMPDIRFRDYNMNPKK